MSRDQPTRSRVPVTVLTGFLGAGKTTLLNHLLRADHGRRIAVAVNDFGDINIDAELVVGVEEDMLSLANGCVCCQVREDLVESIAALLERSERPDHIVLEASGVADPMGLVATFTQESFVEQLDLDGVVAVVDTASFLSDEELRLHKLRQVVCSDLVVLNKTDLASPDEQATVRAWIDERTVNIRYVEASYADVPLEILLGGSRRSAREVHTLEHAHGAQYSTSSVVTEAALNPDALRRTIKALPPTIYRVKGIIATTDDATRRAILQAVGRRTSIEPGEPWGAEKPSTRIVAIGAAGTHVDRAVHELVEASVAPA